MHDGASRQVDGLPRDVAGGVGAEESRELCHVLGGGDALERGLGRPRGDGLRAKSLVVDRFRLVRGEPSAVNWL
jgi:hypothetical protein